MKQFKTPNVFTAQYVRGFLTNVSEIFRLSGMHVHDVEFVTENIKKIDLLGLVLIYKFFEYTVRKGCFSAPQCHIKKSKYVYDELTKYGFRDIVYDFIDQKPVDYKKLKSPVIEKGVVVSPFFLEKDSLVDEVSTNSKELCTYYKNNSEALFIILTCLGEIASNFRSHAVSDTQSIMAAVGSNDVFEIACVDTGDGIVSTLKSQFARKENNRNYQILKKSVERGVSSKSKKDTDHMGLGLWLVNQLVTSAKGEFHLLSEGAYFFNHQGSERVGACSFWKGTIVYIKLPLTKIDSCMQVLKKFYKEKHS